MLYAIPFGLLLTYALYAAIRSKGLTEIKTISLLWIVWIANGAINYTLKDSTPYMEYAILDFAAILILMLFQTRNWQHVIASLYAAMILTHFLLWAGITSNTLLDTGHPYQDFLAGLGYLQIFFTIYISNARNRSDNTYRNFTRWCFAVDLVWMRYLGRRNNERPI